MAGSGSSGELSDNAHVALFLAANTDEPTQLSEEDILSYQFDLRHTQRVILPGSCGSLLHKESKHECTISNSRRNAYCCPQIKPPEPLT